MRRRLVPVLFALAASACGGEDAQPPKIVSFTASAAQVGLGDRVQLSWKVENAVAVGVTATPGGVLIEGSSAAENTVPSGAITAATRFVLTARGSAGDTVSAEVAVAVDATLLRISRFVATPAEIEPGQMSTLSWTIAGSPIGQVRLEDAAGAALFTGTEATGMQVVAPQEAAVYTLKVSNVAQTITATAAVRVRASPPTIVSFTANPNPAATGTRGTVSWVTERAAEVQIKRDGTIVRPWNANGATMGFTAFTFTEQSSVFTLEARNAFGEVSQDLTINTLARPVATLEVSPTRFTGTTTTVSVRWTTANADTIALTIGGRVPGGFSGQASGMLSFTATRTVDLVLTAQNPIEAATERVTVRRAAVFVQEVVEGDALTPVAGAAVRVEDATGARFFEGTTDAAGRATIDIEAELYPVSVSVAKAAYFATAVVGLPSGVSRTIRIDPVPQAPNPPPPDPVIGDLAGTFYNRSSINNRAVVTGVDVQGSDGGGVSYMMQYIVSNDPMTLVALDYDANDGLYNAVVTSTVRTPGPMSVDITFPRPPLAVVNTDVVLAVPSTGVFSGQRYTLAGQAVVQQTPGKNDVQVGESTMSGLGSTLTWRIQSFAEPGLEVDLAGIAVNGTDLRVLVLERMLMARRVPIAPLPRFAYSGDGGLLTELRLDFDGPDYTAAVVELGTQAVPVAYRVIFPAGVAHAGARIPRLPSTVGFRGIGVGIAGNVDANVSARVYTGPAELAAFDGPDFGFARTLSYTVDRVPGSFALAGF